MIDKELQAELRAKYNPDGSELRKRQLRMLEMLKYIDRICQEQGISYWLSSGTCLGAIRHGGFIPWDDDVDIELAEKDYEKLVDYLLNHETDDFVLQSHETDPEYIMDFAKLRDKKSNVNEIFGIDKKYKYQGLYIDIFKMVPSGSKSIHYLCGRLRVLEVYIKRWSLNNRILLPLFRLVRGCNNIVIKLLKPIDCLVAEGYLRHTLGVSFLLPRLKSDVSNVIKVPFEDSEFPVPANFDSYLYLIFGDYLKLKIDHQHMKDSLN